MAAGSGFRGGRFGGPLSGRRFSRWRLSSGRLRRLRLRGRPCGRLLPRPVSWAAPAWAAASSRAVPRTDRRRRIVFEQQRIRTQRGPCPALRISPASRFSAARLARASAGDSPHPASGRLRRLGGAVDRPIARRGRRSAAASRRRFVRPFLGSPSCVADGGLAGPLPRRGRVCVCAAACVEDRPDSARPRRAAALVRVRSRDCVLLKTGFRVQGSGSGLDIGYNF